MLLKANFIILITQTITIFESNKNFMNTLNFCSFGVKRLSSGRYRRSYITKYVENLQKEKKNEHFKVFMLLAYMTKEFALTMFSIL